MRDLQAAGQRRRPQAEADPGPRLSTSLALSPPAAWRGQRVLGRMDVGVHRQAAHHPAALWESPVRSSSFGGKRIRPPRVWVSLHCHSSSFLTKAATHLEVTPWLCLHPFYLQGSLNSVASVHSLAAQTVKHPPVVRETWVLSLGQEDSPGGRHGNPLQYSLENPHGQRSLVGYSPWCCKE